MQNALFQQLPMFVVVGQNSRGPTWAGARTQLLPLFLTASWLQQSTGMLPAAPPQQDKGKGPAAKVSALWAKSNGSTGQIQP